MSLSFPAAHRRLALPCAAVLCLGLLSAVPATQPAAVDPQRIALATAQLGDPDPAIRERATLLLWSMGKPAEPALDEAARGADPEVAFRARQVLSDIRVGLGPNDSPQIIAAIHDYRRADPLEKPELISTLMNLKAYTVLARLCASETSEMLRGEISRQLSQKVAEAVPAMVSKGDLATAEQWLDIGLMDGSDASGRAYAMYYLLRGQIEPRIAKLQLQAAPHALRGLTLLYRAKGDLARARQAAEKCHDQELLDDILYEQGDWKTLAGQIQQSVGDEADLEHAGLLATYHRLSGDDNEFNRSLDLVHRYDGAKDQAMAVAHILLLNDRPDDALAVLTRHQQVASVFMWLWAQRKYAQALDLVKEGPKPAEELLTQKAMLLYQLGRGKQSADLLASVARSAGQDPMALFSIAQAEIQCEQIDAAFAHASQALDSISQSEGILMAFQALFPGQDKGAVTWWNYFRSCFPQDKPRQTLDRLRRLLRHEMTAEELPAVVDRAVAFARGMMARDRGRFLGLLGSVAFESGQQKLGQSILKEAASAHCHDILLGELAVLSNNWSLAADLYAAAEPVEPDTAVSAALRGYSLLQAGQKPEGRKILDLANLVILANGRKRCELADALERIGLIGPALEQYQLVLRTEPFFSSESALAAFGAAPLAARQHDYDLAVSSTQRLAFQALKADTQFTRQREYVFLPSELHRYRAAALLRAGQPQEALKQIKLAQALLPGDVSTAIDLVVPLEKAGLGKEADALFSQCYAVQQKLCTDYPDSPQVRNEMAWLLARCHRNLEEGLTQAQKAVDLAPKNAAIIDTLAEVHFQLGQKQQAIDLIKRCIALEPATLRHRLALKRLEEQPPESAPIE